MTELAVALPRARPPPHIEQPDVGQAIGRSARSVGRWELGRTTPRPSERRALLALFERFAPAAIPRLARALGVEHVPLARGWVDETIRVEAEALDVTARRLRESIVRVLRALGPGDLTLKAAIEALG
jgi:hypothetical protein